MESEIDEIIPNLNLPDESKLGKRLSELTTRRVIILVLGMMFAMPLLNMSMYYEHNSSARLGLVILDKFVNDPHEYNFVLNYYIESHKDLNIPLIYLEV